MLLLLRLETAVQGAHKKRQRRRQRRLRKWWPRSCAFAVSLFPWTWPPISRGKVSTYDTRKGFGNSKRPPWTMGVKHSTNLFFSTTTLLTNRLYYRYWMACRLPWTGRLPMDNGLRQVQALSLGCLPSLGAAESPSPVPAASPRRRARAHQLAVSVQPPPTPAL
jgi:hypothetical protein